MGRLGKFILCLTVAAAVLPSTTRAAERSTLILNDEVEIDVVRFGESGNTAIVWFACNQGEDSIEFATARKLHAKGYRVYFPDMLSAHFLSPLPSNIARVPAAEVAAVIEYILHTSSAEQVFLLAGARAAIPVVRGLATAQLQRRGARLKGALLITPRLTKRKPEPGQEPVYIDEAGRSIHPLFILEGERTPNRWGLAHLVEVLGQSGSVVQTDLIAGVRGYFYLRNDQTEAEIEVSRNLDTLIHDNLQRMSSN